MLPFKALDFFAGSGLATQALSQSFDVLWGNDNCKKKADVYLANHSSRQVDVKDQNTNKELHHGDKVFALGDVANVEGFDFPEVTLSWASFPCQDLSLAGNLSGINGSRSGLVWHWLRIMDEMPEYPPLLVAENVTGLVSANGGKHYKTLHNALRERGYKAGAVILDAFNWLPQSRPRVFVIAVRKEIDTECLEGASSWVQNSALIKASQGLEDFVWWRLPVPKERTQYLSDLIDFDVPVDNAEASERSLMLIPDSHRRKLERFINELKVVPGYKRTRQHQVLELRFDGAAGCLRTPQGGSSRQWLVLKKNDEFASRLLTAREAARLMGAPDSYQLPGSYNDGYKAMGDAVAVPVVRYLTENLLLPLAHRSHV